MHYYLKGACMSSLSKGFGGRQVKSLDMTTCVCVYAHGQVKALDMTTRTTTVTRADEIIGVAFPAHLPM